MVPGLTQRYYRINPCEGNSATLRLNLVNLYGGVGFAARVGTTAARLRLVLSVLDAVENFEEMDQPTFRRHALKGERSLKEAAMRMKNPAHPGELVAANLKDLGLSVAEAAKAIGVTREQLYNTMSLTAEAR